MRSQQRSSIPRGFLPSLSCILDAPLATFGDINRGDFPTEFGQRTGNIFSYVMNKYWHTNYRAAQGGHFRFRYVITSAIRTDAAALSRMGWKESTPLEQDQIHSQDKALDLPRPLNGDEASFLTIDDPDLLLDTWKPAEDGNGTILRFIDLGGEQRSSHAGGQPSRTKYALFVEVRVSICAATPGSIPSDANGNADVDLSFAVTGEVDGIFLFTRTPGTQELNEFVTAFRIL